jgi:hypothetical protein
MELMLPIQIPQAPRLIDHRQKILSVGSCFTEHIGNALKELKFSVLQNPNGILFDPASVCSSLVSYVRNEAMQEQELFQLNELWHSWQHHSRFSGMDKNAVLEKINAARGEAHEFLADSDWLIITLGSSFSYRLVPQQGTPVANCHRAPAQWFRKHMMPVDEIIAQLDNTLHQLFRFNAKLSVLFTISPVRHIRDGVMDNNRSKARLIESVHHLVNKFDKLYYFPAYELVIDVLRDYRFYDIDMVHPNYLATEFVLQQFLQTHTSEETRVLTDEIKKIAVARRHRAAHPHTEAHKKFLASHLEKTKTLQQQHPYLDFTDEIGYFSKLHS